MDYISDFETLTVKELIDLDNDARKEENDSLKLHFYVVNKNPEILIVSVKGYIDSFNSTLFQKRILLAIDSGLKKIIFDCQNTNYISSSGFDVFSNILKIIEPLSGNMVLLNLAPMVQEVLQLLGLKNIFILCHSLNDAVNCFCLNNMDSHKNIFPKVIKCPICCNKGRVNKTGRIRCSECKTILGIDETGNISLSN